MTNWYRRLLARLGVPAGASISADNAAIKTVVDGVQAQTDKLAGASPTVGSVSANWNTATGTSGESGEDLCTIGADGVLNKVLSLVIAIDAATAGAVITVKMFQQVDGVERKVYSEGFVKGTDPDGLWIIAGVVGIHEALRVEVYSDTNEAVEFDFDYMLEVM